MEPGEVSYVLRRIAANIDKAKRPNRELVVRDLRTLLATMRVSVDCHSLGEFIFPKGSKYVKDGDDHFPAANEECARQAWSRVNQYDKAPPWFDGSLKQMMDIVAKHVRGKGVEISEESMSPGKG